VQCHRNERLPTWLSKNKTTILYVQWQCRKPSSSEVWHDDRLYNDLYLESAGSRDLEHPVQCLPRIDPPVTNRLCARLTLLIDYLATSSAPPDLATGTRGRTLGRAAVPAHTPNEPWRQNWRLRQQINVCASSGTKYNPESGKRAKG
jgi:hypothetical protein